MGCKNFRTESKRPENKTTFVNKLKKETHSKYINVVTAGSHINENCERLDFPWVQVCLGLFQIADMITFVSVTLSDCKWIRSKFSV